MSPLIIAQIVLAALLIVFILLQSRGSGLGAAWGGGGELYTTRRGMEKILLRLTIITASLFIGVSFFSLLS